MEGGKDKVAILHEIEVTSVSPRFEACFKSNVNPMLSFLSSSAVSLAQTNHLLEGACENARNDWGYNEENKKPNKTNKSNNNNNKTQPNPNLKTTTNNKTTKPKTPPPKKLNQTKTKQGKTRSVPHVKRDVQFVTICLLSDTRLPLYELPLKTTPTECVPFK